MLTILGRPAKSLPLWSSTSLASVTSLTTSVYCGPMYRLKSGPYLLASLEKSRCGGRGERRCSRLPRTGTLGKQGSGVTHPDDWRRPSMHFNTNRSNRATTQQKVRDSAELIRVMMSIIIVYVCVDDSTVYKMCSVECVQMCKNEETKVPAQSIQSAEGGGTFTQPSSGG